MHARMAAADRRSQILEIAIDLFSRKGFSGTTTKEIAAAAGVTEALIFRHFATKQDLYTAIIDYKLHSSDAREWLAETRACMDRNDDEGLFRAIATKIIQVYRTDPRFERIMLYAGLEGHELANLYHRQFAIPIFDMLRDYIARRQRARALRACNPGLVVLAIAGMAQHYGMSTQFYGVCGLGFSDKEAIDAFTGILMKGLRLQPK